MGHPDAGVVDPLPDAEQRSVVHASCTSRPRATAASGSAPAGSMTQTRGVDLAKPHLDIGMHCADLPASRAFYEDRLGLPYEELLKLGGGHRQHRLGLVGAVLKLNESREPVPPHLPTCLRGLTIASTTVDEPVALVDPDGTPVGLVPAGGDIETVEVRWASRSPGRLGELLAGGLGARPVGDDRWKVGSTTLQLVEDPAATHAVGSGAGFRYLTVQVRDVVAEHTRMCALGWAEDRAPVRLGDVAAISFVRDPDGTLLEISQRASLTGPLHDL
jgi:catechol 2,3-dioxygenase-like lactoylglutathione lyase family enzyme